YGCGGVKAAVTHQSFGLINKWLRSIKDVYRIHESELAEISNEDERVDRLVELNVQEQVLNLAKTSIIQRAWKYENRPHLHGWVYSLEDGLLKQIFTMPPKTRLDDLYEYDNL
ncbi:MAG: carbonic anhydrase, partial [Candidatus Kapaibacterium sp.]